jgi:N-methylhydantoinase A
MGLLAAPVVAETVRTSIRDLAATSAEDLRAGWERLEGEALDTLAAQGIDAAAVRWSADCRYRGQGFELDVEAPPDGRPHALAEAFHRTHHDRYGFRHSGASVEVVNLRVRAEGAPPRPALPRVPPGRGAAAARTGSRPVSVGGVRAEAAVYARDLLGEGDRVAGPAVVAGLDATCLLMPGQVAGVDSFGNLLIREGTAG